MLVAAPLIAAGSDQRVFAASSFKPWAAEGPLRVLFYTIAAAGALGAISESVSFEPTFSLHYPALLLLLVRNMLLASVATTVIGAFVDERARHDLARWHAELAAYFRDMNNCAWGWLRLAFWTVASLFTTVGVLACLDDARLYYRELHAPQGFFRYDLTEASQKSTEALQRACVFFVLALPSIWQLWRSWKALGATRLESAQLPAQAAGRASQASVVSSPSAASAQDQSRTKTETKPRGRSASSPRARSSSKRRS
jgi:hypothetical protein